MFSCCLPTSQGPGQGQPQAADILQSYRHWVSPRPQQLWQFSQRETKVISDMEPVPSPSPASSVGTQEAGKVEKLVSQLVPAQQRGDRFIVPAFLLIYHKFTTTQQVLHLLFQRYASFQPHCEEDDRTKDALCSLLGTWLDRYPEHFCQPQDLTCLHQLLAYVQLHMPFSDLALRAQRLLTQLEDPEPKEAVYPQPRTQSHRGEGGCGQKVSDSADLLLPLVPSAPSSVPGGTATRSTSVSLRTWPA
uniref:N-terminal Ras-GEF domain-containing protein n=1 Tax=Oryctolagus cuniculus TaxID=9986 RepID=G1TJG1_RABIT